MQNFRTQRLVVNFQRRVTEPDFFDLSGRGKINGGMSDLTLLLLALSNSSESDDLRKF